MYEGSITIRLRADVHEIERLNRIIRAWGELHEVPGRPLYTVNLAIDELVTNALLYGFGEPLPAGEALVVRLEAREGALHASIEDCGRPFDPLSVPPPDLSAPLGQREIGGLGVHLVRMTMDNVSYAREGEKNVLTIAKNIR